MGSACTVCHALTPLHYHQNCHLLRLMLLADSCGKGEWGGGSNICTDYVGPSALCTGSPEGFIKSFDLLLELPLLIIVYINVFIFLGFVSSKSKHKMGIVF